MRQQEVIESWIKVPLCHLSHPLSCYIVVHKALHMVVHLLWVHSLLISALVCALWCISLCVADILLCHLRPNWAVPQLEQHSLAPYRPCLEDKGSTVPSTQSPVHTLCRVRTEHKFTIVNQKCICCVLNSVLVFGADVLVCTSTEKLIIPLPTTLCKYYVVQILLCTNPHTLKCQMWVKMLCVWLPWTVFNFCECSMHTIHWTQRYTCTISQTHIHAQAKTSVGWHDTPSQHRTVVPGSDQVIDPVITSLVPAGLNPLQMHWIPRQVKCGSNTQYWDATYYTFKILWLEPWSAHFYLG